MPVCVLKAGCDSKEQEEMSEEAAISNSCHAQEIEECAKQIDEINHQLQGGSLTDEERAQLEDVKKDVLELVGILTEQQRNGDVSTEPAEEARRPRHQDDGNSIDLDDFVGCRCSAPYGLSFGHKLPLKYHNAIILEAACDFAKDSIENLKVKVLYTNPLYRSMRPCQFFLQGRCSYANECRFSHGEEVDIADLLEYSEPNFEDLTVGSSVLAMRDSKEQLWELGTVAALDDEKLAVRWFNSLTETAVARDHAIPVDLELHHDHPNEEASSGGLESNYRSDVPSFSGEVGNWEKHTKGIGSKLMAKMGYLMGQGLGKTSSGITEPVNATVLPKGKSLDYCMDKKNKGKLLSKVKKSEKKERLKQRVGQVHTSLDMGIFDFLNARFENTSSSEKPAKNSEICTKTLKSESKRRLNIRSLKLEEQVKQAKKDVERYREAVKRNDGTNKVVARKMREKLNEAQAKVHSLSEQIGRISAEQNSRQQSKQMGVF